MIKIIIDDINGKQHTIQVSSDLTGYQVKTIVYNQFTQSLTQNEMELTYQGTKLQNNKKLSTFNVVVGVNLKFKQEKVDLNQVSAIVAQDQQDPITLEDLTVKMACGHSIGRDCMTALVRSLIQANKYDIRCPYKSQSTLPCNMEWDFRLCRKIGVFTKEETEQFEDGLSRNWIKNFAKQCPKCKFSICKGNLKSNRVVCPSCKYGDFCYSCLSMWKGYGNFCGSETCHFVNEFLAKAQMNRKFQLKDTKDENKVKTYTTPQYRACPHCFLVIEHKEACKHMTCPGCQKKFCWVCLVVYDKKWNCGGFNEYCGKVAQKQTFQI